MVRVLGLGLLALRNDDTSITVDVMVENSHRKVSNKL